MANPVSSEVAIVVGVEKRALGKKLCVDQREYEMVKHWRHVTHKMIEVH